MGVANPAYIAVWDLATVKRLLTIKNPPYDLNTVVLSHAGDTFAKATPEKGFIFIRDTTTGAVKRKMQVEARINKLVFGPGDNFLIGQC